MTSDTYIWVNKDSLELHVNEIIGYVPGQEEPKTLDYLYSVVSINEDGTSDTLDYVIIL